MLSQHLVVNYACVIMQVTVALAIPHLLTCSFLKSVHCSSGLLRLESFPSSSFLMLEMRSCVREETSKRGIYPVSSSDVDLYFKGTAAAAAAADGPIENGDNI